ncbi:MAG: HAMP domain-containing sensor histidine kinase [Syntrophomonas sp.]
MSIRKGITMKLFVLMLLFFGTFTSLLIYVQLFVVSRLYLTTEYTKQREAELNSKLLESRFIWSSSSWLQLSDHQGRITVVEIDKNSYRDAILKDMAGFENANQAYVVIFDANYQVKYITAQGQKELGSVRLRNISDTLKNDIDRGQRRFNFRVKDLFGLPSKYIALSMPRYMDNSDPSEYVVAVTQEVYTDDNVGILKTYVLYIFIVSLFFTIIIAAILSYLITRPVLKINKTASRMSEMDFSEKCDVQSNDELGNLARSLNFLSEKLDATLNQLQDANEQLRRDLDVQRELDLLRKDFIAGVSHDFKTPVTLIKGYAESIKDKVAQEDEREMAVETIIKEADRIDKLVQDLLNLSSMESSGYQLEWSDFYIDELLMSISGKYELFMKEKGIVFIIKPGCPDILVRADSFRVEEVIRNFLDNAMNHTEAGKAITIASQTTDGSVFISVENQGRLIPDEELSRIWEKFYRTDKSRTKRFSGGTGLGLAICRAILDKHGCTYGVQSTNSGVRFYFYLDTVN